MTPLLELLNRLLAEGLAQEDAPGAGRAVQVRSVVLDEAGAHIVAALAPPAGEGELVLRLRAEPPEGERQTLALTVERGPAGWAPALEPFRRVLERARVRIDLDFGP